MTDRTDNHPVGKSEMAQAGFGANQAGVSSSMMEESPSYGGWIATTLGSRLRGHLLELGCGTGVYTPHFLNLPHVERVTATDVAPHSIALAKERVQDPRVEFLRADVKELEPARFDSVICANVAEHIEDDIAFFRSLSHSVKPGGGVAVLVPAHPSLYSRYDHEAGHYRRYTKKMLRDALTSADLAPDRLFFFNAFGALGWLYAFKWKQRGAVSEESSRGMIRIFDAFVLPVGRVVESIVPPPFGLSLIAFSRRPEGS